MVKSYTSQLKNPLLALCFVLFSVSGFAQTITYTGNGTTPYPASQDERRPYGVYFGFERTVAVYAEGPTELNIPVGSIVTSVGFRLNTINNPPNIPYNVKIYMREVASPTVASLPTSSFSLPLNLVYDGNVTLADWVAATWVTRTLTYNGPVLVTTGSNLEFYIETNYFTSTGDPNGWFPVPGNPNNIAFNHHTKASSALWWQADGSPPAGNGSVQANRPDIQLNYVAATPCTGPPVGTVAVASANPVCATPFNLSITGVPPQSGLTFQWFVSTTSAAGPWAPIPLATFPFYQATQNVPSWYYCQTTCGTSSNSTVIAVGQNPVTNCYCPSAAGFTGDGDIGNVQFATINNPPGGCTPTSNNPAAVNGYTNYTQTVAVPNIQQGLTYPINLCQITFGNNVFASYFNTFIDYNRDGNFDPIYERVFNAGSTSNTGPFSFGGTVTIPFSSTVGRTRMRVILREFGNNTQDPCGTFNSWGETEDYDVNITPGVACGNPVIAGTAVSTLTNVCATQSFTLSITGNTTLGSGQTWQWQSSSTSVIGPWTNILGATLPNYTTTQPASPDSVWYRCVITCSAGIPVGTIPVLVISNPPTLCYCNALHSVGCGNFFISNVTLNTLNNNSVCTSGNGQAYTVYPASGTTTTSITQNSTYLLSVTTSGSSSQSISVWIDWDANGTFAATEWYGLTGNPPAIQAVGTYSLPINVPATSATGLTGMRVRTRVNTLNGAPDACLQFGSGESEDYLITINPFVPPTCTFSPVLNTTVDNSSPCGGQQVNLSLAPNPVPLYGNLGYQWQIDSNGIWVNIAGATGPTLPTSLTHRYARFRCLVTCIPCCLAVASNPVTVNNTQTKWLGFTNDWSDGQNWCGRVPTALDSVLISLAASGRPAASYNSPIVSSGSALTVYNLQIDATDSLTVLADSLMSGFTIGQHVVNNGKMVISSTSADTLQLSNGPGLFGTTYSPFRGAVSDQICQIIYTASELGLSGEGLRRNDVIDSLLFHFRVQASTQPYQNFRIAYGFTTDAQFSSPTLLTGLTEIYFNPSLDVATLVPGVAGTLKIPVTGFKWHNDTDNMVLQICYNTTSLIAGGNDVLYTTVTSAKQYLQISNSTIGTDGCLLTMIPLVPGSTASFSPTQNRPNITFRYHRPQRTVVGSIGTAGLTGGGFKNNGSGSAFFISQSNMTINGTVNNDGAIRLDSTNLTIAPNASYPIADYLNNSVTDLTYSPAGVLRKSQIFFNGTTWSNGGTLIPGTKSRVVFGGANNQIIGGANPTTFNAFRMEKGGATQSITLNNSIVVNDSLVLNQGRIFMNQKSITVNNPTPAGIYKFQPTTNGVLISEDSLSKVNWNIGTNVGAHIIPFANTAVTHYIPFTINNISGDLGTITFAQYPTAGNNTPYPPGVTHINATSGGNDSVATANRYWMLSRSSAAANTSTLSFAFTDPERPVAVTPTGATQGKAQPWTTSVSPSNAGWRPAPGVQTYTFLPAFPLYPTYSAPRVNTVNVPNYTWTFGNSNPWAVGNSNSPLPISLLSFDAQAVEDKARVKWVTASEKDNDYFTVERTLDFKSSISISQVASQGNSNDNQYYETWDNTPEKGINYYRLMQTDFGGTAQVASDYVAVKFGSAFTFEILFVKNETEMQVIFDYDSNEPVDYIITDMLGKTILSGAKNAAAPGINILRFDATAWPHGMYLVSLQNSEKRVTHKFVY